MHEYWWVPILTLWHDQLDAHSNVYDGRIWLQQVATAFQPSPDSSRWSWGWGPRSVWRGWRSGMVNTTTGPRHIHRRRRVGWRWCVWRCTAVCWWWSCGGCRGGRGCNRTAPCWPYAIWTGARTAGTRARPRRRRALQRRPRTRVPDARGWWRTASGCTTRSARTATTVPSRASTRTGSNSCPARTSRPGTRSARRTLCETPWTTPCPPACPCPAAGAYCTAVTWPAGIAATPFWSSRICRPRSCTPVCAVPADSPGRTPRLQHAKTDDKRHHRHHYNHDNLLHYNIYAAYTVIHWLALWQYWILHYIPGKVWCACANARGIPCHVRVIIIFRDNRYSLTRPIAPPPV